MKRALVLLALLLLTGCGGKENMEGTPKSLMMAGIVTAAPTAAPTPTAEPTATPTAAPTPTPTATPEPTPTPLFLPKEEESNDLVINQDLYDSFTETEFPLPTVPVVLIYHTHAEEAYRQTRGYAYAETGEGTYKTLDKKKSVVALGELLKRELEQRGFTVIHDDTDVEPPEIKSAYSRSLEVMERYPEAVVYIDLHRNTANVKAKKDDVVTVEGQRCARMFFVVGTGIGTYEGEYDNHRAPARGGPQVRPGYPPEGGPVQPAREPLLPAGGGGPQRQHLRRRQKQHPLSRRRDSIHADHSKGLNEKTEKGKYGNVLYFPLLFLCFSFSAAFSLYIKRKSGKINPTYPPPSAAYSWRSRRRGSPSAPCGRR